MNPRERHSLRDLLGYASRAQAPQEFCQRVTLSAHSVRQHSASPLLLASAGAASVLVLALGAALFLVPESPHLADRTHSGSEQTASRETWAEEFEGIVLMDELLAVNDPAQLDDEGIARLLFR